MSGWYVSNPAEKSCEKLFWSFSISASRLPRHCSGSIPTTPWISIVYAICSAMVPPCLQQRDHESHRARPLRHDPPLDAVVEHIGDLHSAVGLPEPGEVRVSLGV